MKPPADAWAAWIYRGAMMILGVFSIASMIWLHIDVSYGDWPVALAGERLKLMGWLGIGHLSLLGVQQVGLVARNLVRNLKINGPAGMSVDVNSHEGIAE
jgi:hypothetical protein